MSQEENNANPEGTERTATPEPTENKGPKCEFCGGYHGKRGRTEDEVGFHLQVKLNLLPEKAADEFLPDLVALLNEKRPNDNVALFVFSQFAGRAAARAEIDLVEAIQIMVFSFSEAYKDQKKDEAKGPLAALNMLRELLGRRPPTSRG